jgi:FkbM family methyltransferase
MELMRARTFATKEEGTVEWIRSSVRPGQVFCDIGANIGLYSLLAAQFAGPAGLVYAFEPHVVNASGLLANAAANGLTDRVKVLSVALNDTTGFFDFAYSSLEPGAAFNQLRVEPSPASGSTDQPAAVELKSAVSLDDLIARGVVRSPQHVKIDVDGNEPRIVRGMRSLLTGSTPPESVQVEVDPATAVEIHDLMRQAGYTSAVRHDTAHGKQVIAAGTDPAQVAHNVIFRRGQAANPPEYRA